MKNLNWLKLFVCLNFSNYKKLKTIRNKRVPMSVNERLARSGPAGEAEIRQVPDFPGFFIFIISGQSSY
jgi:hypothetical protein